MEALEFSESSSKREALGIFFSQSIRPSGKGLTVVKSYSTSGFIPYNSLPLGGAGLLSIILPLMLQGCGSEMSSQSTESRLSGDVQRAYGMTYDVPLYCGGTSVAQSLDVVLEGARRLSAFCEQQNVELAKAGNPRCPTGLCQQEFTPGSRPAPTMKFAINNGNSISSVYGGFDGMSSGGSSSSGSIGGIGAVFGSRLYVTLEFNLSLTRNADTFVCVNPLNSTVQTTILNEITKAAFSAKPGNCIPL